jgi:hypothetical protein
MSRDASGNYTLPTGNPVVTATVISSSWANNTLNDIKDALTDSLSRSGQGGMTAPLAGLNGTALVPSYTFSSEPGLGFYRAAAGVLGASGPLQLSGSVTQPLQAVPLQQLTAYQPTFRNAIINGDFSVWQRGTTQTTSGYGSDDRWTNSHVGDLKTASRGTFTLGQTAVPGNPRFFSNTIFAPNVGAANYVAKQHRIEGVRSFSGKNVRLSFWAKALSAAIPIAVDFAQGFGTGGSPSAAVTGIGAQKFNLTTSWQKFTATVAIPSVAGKTIGTSGTDGLELSFWFSAGSDYNSRTATLGPQGGEVQLALVQVEEGTVETTFEFLPPGIMLVLCQRYFQSAQVGSYSTTTYIGGAWPLPVLMRNTPNITYTDAGGNLSRVTTAASGNNVTPSAGSLTASVNTFRVDLLIPSAAGNWWLLNYSLDAEF